MEGKQSYDQSEHNLPPPTCIRISGYGAYSVRETSTKIYSHVNYE